MSADQQLQRKNKLFLQEGFLISLQVTQRAQAPSDTHLMPPDCHQRAAAEVQVGPNYDVSPSQSSRRISLVIPRDPKSAMFPLISHSRWRPPPSFSNTSSMEW